MLNYIALYPNKYEAEFNPNILHSQQDISLEDFIIMEMMELEAIDNIHIENIEIVSNQDEVDINNHMVNINFKKKDMSQIKFPTSKYINHSRFSEIIFTIRIETNLHEKVIEKRILVPLIYDGYYYNNGKRMKAVWQVVDESTYAQRGKNTLKSRNPVIIYQNKKRIITDIEGNDHITTSYSYALNGKQRRSGYGKKPKAKFINPLMIYCAKMGYDKTEKFFGMNKIVFLSNEYDESELDDMYIFQLDNLYIKVYKMLFDKYDLVKSYVCMLYNLKSPKDFPIGREILNDTLYWTCRIGTVGAVRNKNLMSFSEKGNTNLLMIERLLNSITKHSLRLPDYYKQNIYHVIYWIITNFTELRRYSNIDMRNKRIRKNEYIVNSSLGKKLSENVSKVIERKNKSKLNTMDTLLEVFNFGSDIVVAGMRNLNDLIKSDDSVNDMDTIQSLAYSNKGWQALGGDNSKMIAMKYRYLDPSMVGVVDLNVASNSDIGMSGSFTPFVKLYDGFFIGEEREPCVARYNFEKALVQDEGIDRGAPVDSFEKYIKYMSDTNSFAEELQPALIKIVEKE